MPAALCIFVDFFFHFFPSLPFVTVNSGCLQIIIYNFLIFDLSSLGKVARALALFTQERTPERIWHFNLKYPDGICDFVWKWADLEEQSLRKVNSTFDERAQSSDEIIRTHPDVNHKKTNDNCVLIVVSFATTNSCLRSSFYLETILMTFKFVHVFWIKTIVSTETLKKAERTFLMEISRRTFHQKCSIWNIPLNFLDCELYFNI